VLEKFCTDVSSGCSVFDDEHFQHPTYTDFTVVKASDDDINPNISIPIAVHRSLVMMQRSSGISASTLSVVSVVSAMAGRPLPGLSPVSLLLK
jgi:hypothetical protein